MLSGKEILCLEAAGESGTDDAAQKIFSCLGTGSEVVLLIGELGTGKTYLIRQLLRLAGIEEPVTSPTFTLVHHFQTEKNQYIHADLYRLGKEEELIDLDILDFITSPGWVLIEWGERFPSLRQAATMEIVFEVIPIGRRIRVYR